MGSTRAFRKQLSKPAIYVGQLQEWYSTMQVMSPDHRHSMSVYWNAFGSMDVDGIVQPNDVFAAYEETQRIFGNYGRDPGLSNIIDDLVVCGLWKEHKLDNWEAYEFCYIDPFLKPTVDSHCVYFLQAGHNGPIKIGRSTKLNARFASLQTGNHEHLRLLATLPGGRCVESMLHKEFSASRRIGEWFNPTSELLALIQELGGNL